VNAIVATAESIRGDFATLGCELALHAIDLASGADLAVHADTPMVAASIFKPLVALEFYIQAETGDLDPARIVEIGPETATPGPAGLSNFQDAARLSLRDLAYMMLTISDNAATDILIDAVGLSRVNALARRCGCADTHVTSDLRTLLDSVAADFGLVNYEELLQAQNGELGEPAKASSTDRARLRAIAALDPSRATRTTARDMTRFLAAVWSDTAGPGDACRAVRETMGQQLTRRLEPAVPEGGGLAAKSGGLFGVVRNEIGVVAYPDGAHYAVAILTRAREPFVGTAAINAAIGQAARRSIETLRGAQREG
jgi:beta-lactamase class A